MVGVSPCEQRVLDEQDDAADLGEERQDDAAEIGEKIHDATASGWSDSPPEYSRVKRWPKRVRSS